MWGAGRTATSVKSSPQNITLSLVTCREKQKQISEQVLREEVVQMWCDMKFPLFDYNSRAMGGSAYRA